jgi:hypothetical protein
MQAHSTLLPGICHNPCDLSTPYAFQEMQGPAATNSTGADGAERQQQTASTMRRQKTNAKAPREQANRTSLDEKIQRTHNRQATMQDRLARQERGLALSTRGHNTGHVAFFASLSADEARKTAKSRPSCQLCT